MLVINSFFRTGSTALSWAITSAYRDKGKILVEPLLHPQNPNDEIEALRKRTQFNNTNKSIDDLADLCDYFDSLLVDGCLGYKEMGIAYLAPVVEASCLGSIFTCRDLWPCMTSQVQRNFHLWDWESHFPGLLCMEFQDGMQYLIKKCDDLFPSPYHLMVRAWLFHTYYAIYYRNENYTKLVWIEDLDDTVVEVADYIRDILGPETCGSLEEHILHPQGWYPELSEGIEYWWKPKEARTSESQFTNADLDDSMFAFITSCQSNMELYTNPILSEILGHLGSNKWNESQH